MTTLREQLEARERDVLAAQAAKSADSRGRLRPEREDDVRPAFQRDRDRIIHCKAFRRLKHKTQVFFAPTGDHYRTRLTHTLEVSQIARTIAKVLRLHEELTEAIALGHDLGHTPFGHAGERIIDRLMPGGFNHYVQSLRIVDQLENDGRGLNLTWEVRDGIAKHSKGKSGAPVGMADAQRASTIEGQIMRVADLIAYVNANSGFEILGVALDFYEDGDLHILIPTLHGTEAKKQAVPSSPSGRRRWDEPAFFADAGTRLTSEQLAAVRRLHEWAAEHADEVRYGTGTQTGSFNPVFTQIHVRSVFTVTSNGTLTLNFK